MSWTEATLVMLAVSAPMLWAAIRNKWRGSPPPGVNVALRR